MDLFGAAHWWGEQKVSKICHTYHTMIKVGTVIPYLKKIIFMGEVLSIITSILWEFDKKNQYFWGIILGQVLGMALQFYTNVTKVLKTKS